MNLTRCGSLGLLVLLSLPALAQDEAPAKKKEPTAREASLQVAKDYIKKIQQKKARKGLDEHWSFEALCRGIFKKDFDGLSKEDQAACAKTMHGIIAPALTNPQIEAAMSAATYEGFAAKKPARGKVEVSFTVTLAMEGAQPSKQFLWIEKVDEKYRIVDMANNAPEGRLTKTIGAQWKNARKQGITPLDYVRMMAKGG